MLRFRHALPVASLLLLAACSGKSDNNPGEPDTGAPDAGADVTAQPDASDASTDASDASIDGDDAGEASDADASQPTHHVDVTKVDLLFMVDNSRSMRDKQDVLRQAVPELVSQLVTGTPDFPAVKDIHIGIVSSSLGGAGSDACSANEQDGQHTIHNDDQGHLLTRAGADGHASADAQSGFLSFTAGGDPTKLAADFADLVQGVDQFGCGFEAQLESWYRFLVQPDPYASITRAPNASQAALTGVDGALLKQRHDFLRPDSLVMVVLLTDENDSTVDPLAVSAQGWAFENSTFPGSPGGTMTAATSTCATKPLDPNCTACAFHAAPNDAACQANGGYLDSAHDPMNLRFFHMKQRFGVDPQFPITRYSDALTNAKVPDRTGEHPSGAANYVGNANCTNPLFAASLPDGSNLDPSVLCNLPKGSRSPDQVLFAVIGGVPQALLHFDPASPASGKLSADDWTKILGKDPLAYDFTGADPHMLESITPRTGLPAPTAADDADPIHGREWDTGGSDLQYACTFALPQAHDCTDPAETGACDCNAGRPTNPPLCDATTTTKQTRGKAFPAIRELSVARALGDRGVAASICPTTFDTSSPMSGYRPAIKAITDRMAPLLKNGVNVH